MAKPKPGRQAVSLASEPDIYEATRGAKGGVVKGAKINQAQAEIRRKAGRDVVVCGPNLTKNSDLARAIEQAANGTWKRCPPHLNEGPYALPHYQPDPRPPEGHTFYETPQRKAF